MAPDLSSVFLSRKAREWEVVADSFDDLLLLVDADGRVVRGNRAVERWGLCDVRELPGRDVCELLRGPHGDSAVIELVWKRYTDLGYTSDFVEVEAFDASFQRRLHIRLRRCDDLDPRMWTDTTRFPFALVNVGDTTELQRRRERDERVARFDATQLVLRGLAHEIGNPLAALRVTADLMRDRVEQLDADTARAYCERMSDAAQRMNAIVERALSDEGLARVNIAPVRVDRLLDRIESLFRDSMQSAGIEFSVVKPPAGLTILADGVAAEEVLSNALANASTATAAGGSISIDYVRRRDTVVIEVSDNGAGMAPDDLEMLLMPFESSKEGGLGLGAAYSAFLMRRMGGRMRVHSVVGEGTRVECSFRRGGKALPDSVDTQGL